MEPSAHHRCGPGWLKSEWRSYLYGSAAALLTIKARLQFLHLNSSFRGHMQASAPPHYFQVRILELRPIAKPLANRFYEGSPGFGKQLRARPLLKPLQVVWM